MNTKRELLKQKYHSKSGSGIGRVDKLGNPIEFKLTLDEWYSIWEESGKIPSREWVLSRKNDIGHYEMGNVFVQHNVHNIMEGMYPGYQDDEYNKRITELTIKTGYKRKIVRKMVESGRLKLE